MYCPFCYELTTGIVDVDFVLPVDSRTITETKNFAVISDISPLTPGHVLIIPKQHIISFGMVREEHRDELWDLLQKVKNVLSVYYSAPVIMEHGSSSCSDGGGCISHAHLQVCPIKIDLLSELERFKVIQISSFWELADWSKRDKPYLFFQDQDGRMIVADNIDGIEKQFIRIHIARSLGLPTPQWDWRKYLLLENLQQTVVKLVEVWDK